MRENLVIGYHQQDTDYYCGAACAQMVLASIGAGMLDQVPLYNDNHTHGKLDPGVNWATPPDGLTWTLNDRKPTSFSNDFALFALASVEAISRKIAWTIHDHQVAPVALVLGGQHWIVVRGYDASAAPSSSADTSYSIKAFDVNDPWPPTASGGLPPPHAAGDACGTGGTRGIANAHISYATWQSVYMTGVPGGYWNGRFVAVCDPDPPPVGRGAGRPTREGAAGKSLIGPTEAVEYARRGLDVYGLYERNEWGAALDAEPQEPVLVDRLDQPDTYYWIVPMGRGEVELTAAVAVDARYGDYLQAVALPEPAPSHLEPLRRDHVLENLRERRISLPDELDEPFVHPELLDASAVLVWKPCLESLSPFYPFSMATVNGTHLYLRSDGRAFTRLRDDGRGL